MKNLHFSIFDSHCLMNSQNHWWVYPSDTLLWPPIFDFLSFSLHHRSSNIYHADVTSVTFAWTFAWSPSTIHYTHHTIGLVPCQRPPIWPTDHIVIFSFLSLFSFTRHVLSWPNRSQVTAPRDRDLTICFTAHKPCAYLLYLRLLYLLRKRRKFFPRTQT